jgi:hypothetical protein
MADNPNQLKRGTGSSSDRAIAIYTMTVGCVVLALTVLILGFNFPETSLGFFLLPISLGIVSIGFVLATIGVALSIVGAQNGERFSFVVVLGGFVLILIYGGLTLIFLYYAL